MASLPRARPAWQAESCNHSIQPAGRLCRGLPAAMPPMEIASKGILSATPTQNRRCMLRNSESSSSWTPAATRGSRAIPQIGQLPGPLRTISGCMGQVYSTVSGSRAMPHLGHAPGLLSRTSGSMGQTYVTVPFPAACWCGAGLCGVLQRRDSADLYHLAFGSSAGAAFGAKYFSGSALKRFTHPGLQK